MTIGQARTFAAIASLSYCLFYMLGVSILWASLVAPIVALSSQKSIRSAYLSAGEDNNVKDSRLYFHQQAIHAFEISAFLNFGPIAALFLSITTTFPDRTDLASLDHSIFTNLIAAFNYDLEYGSLSAAGTFVLQRVVATALAIVAIAIFCSKDVHSALSLAMSETENDEPSIRFMRYWSFWRTVSIAAPVAVIWVPCVYLELSFRALDHAGLGLRNIIYDLLFPMIMVLVYFMTVGSFVAFSRAYGSD